MLCMLLEASKLERRPGVFRDYITSEQINRYFSKYGPVLSKVGLSFDA